MRSILDRDLVARRLHAFGYAAPGVSVDAFSVELDGSLEDAVRRYQAFHGLTPDGEVGPETAMLLQSPYRCGMPDMMAESERQCQWPMKRVTYSTQINLPGLSPAEADQAFDEACALWNAVCGIELTRTRDFGAANIWAVSGKGKTVNLDGRGGTLAWSYLPCGAKPNSRVQQMYDEDERWIYGMAVPVIAHELGHALGLTHDEAGNLMQPYYSARIKKPQAGDIQKVVARYGEPAKKPVPKPEPAVSATFNINGEIYTGTLSKRSGR